MLEESSLLSGRYGGVWGDHPDYPVSDWQYEVASGYTRQGYWSWVLSRIEGEGPA